MNFSEIFYPQSVAVVGASSEPGSVGNDLVKNLINGGFDGKIFPVNPKITEINKLKCFPNLSQIKEKIDLVIVAVPAVIVPQIIEEIIILGIKGVIIISSGFKESGNRELEEKIREQCAKNEIILIGPNCLGIINPEICLNASFAAMMPQMGEVAFISQSGALCTAIIDDAKALGIGFSKFISLGNKAGIEENDLLEYLATDKKTKVVAIYAEQLTKPEKFIRVVKKLRENEKAVIIIKSGKSEEGSKASASHTGAMAGNDQIYDALFRQAGVIRAQSVADLFDLITVFSNCQPPQNNRVTIVTNAGAGGVLASDEIAGNGLVLAKLSAESQNILRQNLPKEANLNNPIDLLGDARTDRYKLAIDTVLKDENVDSLVVILTPQSMTEVNEIAKIIILAKSVTEKPIIACFMGEDIVSLPISLMRKAGIPCLDFPEQAIRSLAALTKFGFILEEKEEYFDNKFEIGQVEIEGKNKLTEIETLKILKAYNFSILKNDLAKNEDEAFSIGQKIGGKLVLKIMSAEILHKTDVGGVMIGVEIDDIKSKYREMIDRIKKVQPEAKIDGVLVEEMVDIKRGVELILGSNKDPSLGQTVMIGLGGIYVEMIKDISFGIVPILKNDARKMIDETKVGKILNGVRGGMPLDTEAVIEAIGQLSKLLSENPQIKEIDINPLLVLPKGEGVRVLDARMIIEK